MSCRHINFVRGISFEEYLFYIWRFFRFHQKSPTNTLNPSNAHTSSFTRELDTLTQSLTHLLARKNTHIRSRNLSFHNSHIHTFTHSRAHPLTHPFTPLLMYRLNVLPLSPPPRPYVPLFLPISLSSLPFPYLPPSVFRLPALHPSLSLPHCLPFPIFSPNQLISLTPGIEKPWSFASRPQQRHSPVVMK